jgi:predicted kinase
VTGATVHLVTGSTGAGKTTFSRELTERAGAVRFSIDEWMTALFWADAYQPLDPAWVMVRVERCYAQIWTAALAVAKRGVAVVLDLGLTTRESRVRFADLAREAGLPVQLHFVDVPADERWRRVEVRNEDIGEGAQLRFAITREMFDYVEGLWEAPDDAEMALLNGVRVGAAA